MANSADPDQLASPTDLDLHCLQRQGVSGSSRTRVNIRLIQGQSKVGSNGKSVLSGSPTPFD